MAAQPYLFILITMAMGSVVGLGDFKKKSMADNPVFDVGDGASIVIQAYPCRIDRVFTYQLLTINYIAGETSTEIGWAQSKGCVDFSKINRELTPGYVSLGDSIYVLAKPGTPVVIIFKMQNGSCQQKTLTDESGNIKEKPDIKNLSKRDCSAAIKKVRPKKRQVGSTTMVVRLDAETFAKAVKSNMMLVGKKSQQQLPTYTTPAGEIKATGAAVGGGGTATVVTAEQAKQPVKKEGWNNPSKPETPMQMVSLDDYIDSSLPNPREGVAWYISDTLVMTLQKLYQGTKCIRLVTIIDSNDVRLARFKTTCGKIRGLTMYPNLIKYKNAFVFSLDSEEEASGYFNMGPKTCLYRKYTIQGGKATSTTDKNENHPECRALTENTSGSILGKEYQDNRNKLAVGVLEAYQPIEDSSEEENAKGRNGGGKNTGGKNGSDGRGRNRGDGGGGGGY